MKAKFRRIIVGVLACLLFLQTVISPIYAEPEAGSNSNDFRATFIDIKRGQSMSDVDVSGLTADELRVIALFISNFYVPFSTTLDGDDENGTQEQIVKSLVNSCNFDEEMAEQLVELCYKYSLSTAKPLYMKGTQDSVREIYDIMLETDAGISDYGLVHLMCDIDGATQLPVGVYRFTYGMLLAAGSTKNMNIKLFYDTSTENTCFEINNAFRQSYGMYCDKLNYTGGIGSGFLSVDEKELETISDEDMARTMVPFQQLYIDWVGNLIVDDGVNRYIILPACANPYTFRVINGDPGKRVNLINTVAMDKLSCGEIKLSVNDEDEPRCTVGVYNGSQSLFNLGRFRFYRGDGTQFVMDSNEGFWFTNIGAGEVGKLCESILSKSGYLTVPGSGNNSTPKFPNWGDILSSTALSNKSNYRLVGVANSYLGDFIFCDTLQAYDGDNSYFKTSSVKESKGSSTRQISFSSVKDLGQTSKVLTDADMTKIYLTYLFAYANYQSGATTFNKEENLVDMVFCGDLFPQEADNAIDWSKAMSKYSGDKVDQEIKSMIYYILHPSEGMRYFGTWAKNKISGFFLGWHEDMVGATSSNATTGMTRYIGFTGYTTLPNLADLSWTSWLLSNYNSIIVYLIILISVILCCYIITGSMTGQQALIGGFMFAVLAFFPPVVINMAVNIVNTTCDTIYGSKFNYWALVQHKTYLSDLYAATSSGNAEDYTEFLLQYTSSGDGGSAESSDNGFSSVKLKWMSPKKDNYLAGVSKELEEDTGLSSNVTGMVTGMLSSQASGQNFLAEPDALYLYRDYMNITTYAFKSYNLYNTYYGGIEEDGNKVVDLSDGDYKMQVAHQWKGGNGNKNIKYQSGVPFQKMVFANLKPTGGDGVSVKNDLRGLSSVNYIDKGFLYNTFPDEDDVTKVDYYGGNTLGASYLLNFQSAYNDMYYGYNRLSKDISSGTTVIGKDYLLGYGLPQVKFNFTQSDLRTSKGGSSSDGISVYTKDALDYFYYGIYSESPYYFFSYNIQDQMNACQDISYTYSTGGGSEGNFKDMILGDNLDYFYNYAENSGDGYGELRDFMNMHDLFYYVIPLMNYGDEFVETFDRVYGMNLYDDVKVRFTAEGDVTVVDGDGETCVISDLKIPYKGTLKDVDTSTKTDSKKYKDLVADWSDEKIYKFWHNYNVTIMYNAYCTWVDTMYDCNYAKSETITVAGKKYNVANPLDPTSYFKVDLNDKITEGRPMVFSKSEMKYYGLEISDLTQVEKKILDIEESVYEKSIDLLNYYTFPDDVLISAFGMLQLFEFNKEFSQTSLVGEDFVMYPQGYELKAFTYDAYLRLILSNTTGDDLQSDSNESLYERIIKNTSITFGLFLIILDIIAVYIIPAFKLFFLIALFLMSILMIIASAVKIELNMLNVAWKSLLQPLISFSAVSIGLAFIVSLFMYNGAKGVTGNLTPTIQLGDPTMVVIVMIVINAVSVYLYYKICKQAGKDFIKYAKAVWSNVGGNVFGALKKVTGLALAGKAISDIRGDIKGIHDAKQQGRSNMPSPHTTGGGSGSGSGGGSDSESSGGIAGAAAAGAGAGFLAGQAKEAGSEGAGKNTTEDYNSKMKSGEDKLSTDKDKRSKTLSDEDKKKLEQDVRSSNKSVDNKLRDKEFGSIQSEQRGSLQKSISAKSGERRNRAIERAKSANDNVKELKARRETLQRNGGEGLGGVTNSLRVKQAQVKAGVARVKAKGADLTYKGKQGVANKVNNSRVGNAYNRARARSQYMKKGSGK